MKMLEQWPYNSFAFRALMQRIEERQCVKKIVNKGKCASVSAKFGGNLTSPIIRTVLNFESKKEEKPDGVYREGREKPSGGEKNGGCSFLLRDSTNRPWKRLSDNEQDTN
jgi:hypothetical protein